MRKQFQMTKAQLKRLLDACQPVPYMVFGGMPPPDPMIRINAAWREIGREHGCDGSTAQPVSGMGQEHFSAELLPGYDVCEACTNIRPIVDPNVLCADCAKRMQES